MTKLGIPVPPGFTIPTSVCNAFYESDEQLPKDVKEAVVAGIAKMGKLMGAEFGNPQKPLLVSVRSGARASMPGMMDTILNLGLNEEIVRGLAQKTHNPRFALDAYRRFIVAYADIVLGVHKNKFDAALLAARQKAAATLKVDASRMNPAELERKVPDSMLDEASLRRSSRSRRRSSPPSRRRPSPTIR
jgi:pyruvate,orthophosphate dikinase